MSKFDISEMQKQKPNVHMAPLIDIIFLTLVFFMTLSIFNQQETEINISVPKAEQSSSASRSPGEIIVNITEDGEMIVNQQTLTKLELETMLKRVSNLFPNQPVIVRADKQTYHKFVVNVLDACAAANIWNISFATTTEG